MVLKFYYYISTRLEARGMEEAKEERRDMDDLASDDQIRLQQVLDRPADGC